MAHCVSFMFLEGLKKRLSCDDRNDRSEAPEATSFDLGPGGTKEAPCWTVGRRTDPLDRPVGGKTHHVDLKNEQKEVERGTTLSQEARRSTRRVSQKDSPDSPYSHFHLEDLSKRPRTSVSIVTVTFWRFFLLLPAPPFLCGATTYEILQFHGDTAGRWICRF